MKPDWRPLNDELIEWQRAGLRLPIWWRDDDAIQLTPQLARLQHLSEQLGLPVHLAIIPADARPELALSLPNCFVPVVHGWAHRSYALAGQKKSEFGDSRTLDQLAADAQRGYQRLDALFGDRLCPMFVPPWNRIATPLLPALAQMGFRALSTFTPRKAPAAATGLWQINTHLDPINWRGDRGLVPPQELIEQISQQLRMRRIGAADNREPYGILTHHLDHNDAIWDFSKNLIARLLDGPGDVWQNAEIHSHPN